MSVVYVLSFHLLHSLSLNVTHLIHPKRVIVVLRMLAFAIVLDLVAHRRVVLGDRLSLSIEALRFVVYLGRDTEPLRNFLIRLCDQVACYWF